MRASEFDFALPPELIAQKPAPKRDQARLLVLQRSSGEVSHGRFPDLLDYLQPGDLLVLNNSRVIPARLRGTSSATGHPVEVLLLAENEPNDWWAMVRPGKRARLHARILFPGNLGDATAPIEALVVEQNSEGHRRLRFSGTRDFYASLHLLGEVPLPPYIQRTAVDDPAEDLVRYQTVYAETNGSVAAPTAGLHFTNALLNRICDRGVQLCSVTLHVGAGTFAPVKVQTLADHPMHAERFAVSEEAAKMISRAQREGRRVIAVGTTSLRVLESVAATHEGRIVTGAGRTRLFVYPPYRFLVANALLTNFHLPRSTLLMLVSAFAAPGEVRGRDLILAAYAEAMRERYRFFSYGDAMLIL